MPRRPTLPLLLALFWLTEAAQSDETSPARALPAPASEAWQPLEFPLVDQQTQYLAGPDGAEARAECSASALILRLDPPVDVQETPRMRWRWQVRNGIESDANEQEKSGDDFAARVYALFGFDAERSSLWERMQRKLASTLYGDVLPGKAISYVWSRHAQVGSHWQNPYSRDTTMQVLRTGAPAGWQIETVDLGADHDRLIGGARMPLMAIALMTDSDDTCQSALASYADFELLPAQLAPRR